MKYLHYSTLFILLILSLGIFTACQEDSDPAPSFTEEEAEVLEANSNAEVAFNEAFDLGLIATEFRQTEIESDGKSSLGFEKDTEGEEEVFGSCATITVESLGEETRGKKLTIDFGSEGCTGFDGKTRKGKIIVTLTARYFVEGSVVTTTFEDFYVNRVQVEGTKTVTNITPDEGNPTHSISVVGAKLSFPDASTIEWASERTREWASGYETRANRLNPFDDVFLIGGTYSGKNRRNVAYSMTTSRDLELKSACRVQGFFRPSQGIMEVRSTNFPTYTVDFGAGACDNIFTVSIGDRVIQVNN